MTFARNNITNKYLFFVIEAILLVLLIWFYASHSFLLPDPSKPYSSSIPYRLQTNAFLHGNIFLSARPFGALQDFIWTEHGMCQNWGLGVPLLRLPFEWGAKLCRCDPFPDKLILIFYLAVILIIINASLRLILTALGLSTQSVLGLLLRWYLICWILFCPAIANLIQFRFLVYEETIFYGYLYGCLLFSIFWIYLRRPSDQLFLILCLASGFASLIRPTLIAYGLTTLLLATLHTYQSSRNIRLIFLGTLCFCLGLFMDLGFNYIRFGSISEFGYTASICGVSWVDYPQKLFGYPFQKEPFWSAFKEIVSTLFLNHTWQSHTFRYRELTFPGFNWLYLIIVVTGGVLFIIFSYLKSSKYKYVDKNTEDFFKAAYFSLSWGLINFSLIFIFYLYNAFLNARYLCDFAAALSAILITLFLLGISYCHRKKNKRLLSAFLIATGILFYVSNNAFFFNHQPLTAWSTNKRGVQKLVNSFNDSIIINPRLPETFYCGHSYSTEALLHQFAGWDISKDCSVFADTLIFLPSKKCLVLNYSFSNLLPRPPVKVKRDLTFLKLITSHAVKSNLKNTPLAQVTEKFCSDAFVSNNVALYTIGWVKADQLRGDDRVPVTLHWVSASDK